MDGSQILACDGLLDFAQVLGLNSHWSLFFPVHLLRRSVGARYRLIRDQRDH